MQRTTSSQCMVRSAYRGDAISRSNSFVRAPARRLLKAATSQASAECPSGPATRRIKVRRSASGAGLQAFAGQRSRMNASIGLPAGAVAAARAGGPVPSTGAATQRRIVSFCAAESSLCANAGGMMRAVIENARMIALRRIAGNDRRHAIAVRFERLFPDVQPHGGHPRALVRTVAPETGLGHDRPDVPIEPNLRIPRRRPKRGSRQKPSEVHRGFNIHLPASRCVP